MEAAINSVHGLLKAGLIEQATDLLTEFFTKGGEWLMTIDFSTIFNSECFQLLKNNGSKQPSMVQINHQWFTNHLRSKEGV